MTNAQHLILTTIGVMCIPLSLIILRILFSNVLAIHKRWHRTGLWLFALGYAMLSLVTLGDILGFNNSLWIYILADVAFVLGPYIVLGSYALDRVLHIRSTNTGQ